MRNFFNPLFLRRPLHLWLDAGVLGALQQLIWLGQVHLLNRMFTPFAQPIMLVLLESLDLTYFNFFFGGSGVGRIGMIDHDTVEVSNLHRQVLHTQSRVGVSKAVSLAASLAGINPSVEVTKLSDNLSNI